MPACLRPIITLKKSAFAEYCNDHQENKFWRDRYGINRDYLYNRVIMPCGKCINCLRKRQMSYVPRYVAEASKYSEIPFVTLTYNEDTVPLSSTLFEVDRQTGDMTRISLPVLMESVTSPNLCTSLRNDMKKLHRGHVPRYVDYKCFDGLVIDGKEYVVRVTPSVNREDVRLWLKSCRVAYKREFGNSLPDFKYMMVPEYSFKRCRPHYHMLFFGLGRKEIAWMTARWSSRYGFVKTKFVPRINPDNTDGYSLVMRYVSKYVTKGSFECSSVRDGCCEKPRVCQSKGIGRSMLTDQLRSYICCFDLYGKYNLDTLRKENGDDLNASEIDSIVHTIPLRLSFTTSDGCRFAIPRFIIDEVFKEKIKIPDEQNRFIFRKTKIWDLVTAYLFDKYVDLHYQQLRQFLSEGNLREDCEGFSAFQLYEESNFEASEKAGKQKILSFYNKSKM